MYAAFKLVVILGLALGPFGLVAPAVLAAPPANDISGNATVASVGFAETIDTTEATTDAEDVQFNSSCGAPATDASVWYTIDGTDTGVVVDVSQSTYSAGVMVGVGSPGALTTIACAPGGTAFLAAAGTTYYVLAFDDQSDLAGNGGMLSISFSEVPAVPTVELTVNRFGTVNSRTGTATISGTYTCTDADFIDVVVDARQNVGRFTILGSGEFFAFGTCDGVRHRWSAEVFPQNGKFAGGKTATVATAIACGPFDCGNGYAEQVVQLRSGK